MSPDDKPEENDAALRARLAKLDEELRAQSERRAARDAPRGPLGPNGGFGRAMSAGINAFSEFVAGIVVGGLIGWQADKWLGTKPWLLVLFLGLGVAAGFLNIYRMAARQQQPSEDKPPESGET